MPLSTQAGFGRIQMPTHKFKSLKSLLILLSVWKISQELKVTSPFQAHFGLFYAHSAALDVELDWGTCSQNILIKLGFYNALVATFF